MSHRRKSARPTNRHWRNEHHTFEHSPLSSCDDDGDPRSSAPGPVTGSIVTGSVPVLTLSDSVPGSTVTESIPGTIISGSIPGPTVSGSVPGHIVSGSVPVPIVSVSVPGNIVPGSGSGPAIEIPADIFKDFEQLKHMTQLDTSALMRNLLKDYYKDPSRSSWQQPQTEQDDQKPVLDDKQVMRQPSKNNNVCDIVEVQQRSPLRDTSCESPIKQRRDTEDQPLDLSLVIKSEHNSPIIRTTVDKDMMASSRLQIRMVSEATSGGSPGLACVSGGVQEPSLMSTNLHLTPICTQGMVMASNMPAHCNLVMSSALPGHETSATGSEKRDCNVMMPVQMSMHLPTVTAVDGEKSVMTAVSIDGQTYAQPGSIFAIIQAVGGNMSAVPMTAISQPVTSVAVTQAPAAVPQPQPPQPQPPPPAQTQQHVPARRGRKPGSINKRTKANKPEKSNEMKIISENTIFPGVYTSILKLPWSRRSRTKAHHPPMSSVQRQTPPSANVVSSNSSGAFSSPAPPGPSPSTTQSVMMVYPNATISALGKPVRKRGRPPKLPVLSHLLSEKKSKKYHNSSQVNQSASVSADGSMLSILNTHSIGAEASSSEVNPSKEVQIVFDLKDTSNLHPEVVPSQTAPSALHVDDTSVQDTINTDSNGSMFQEMLLSSKSLINIKPRKRQSVNVLKSGDNFICTTFRIRPRDSRKKTLVDEPAQAQPGGPPVEMEVGDSFSNDNIDPGFSGLQTETSTDRMAVSPTSTVEDSPLSKNMFHELYHCKVCNEIVPAEDKLAHKQQHIPAKFFCMTCGLEYYSYHQTKMGEDVDTPQNFQCERCSESHKSSLSLTAALQLKRKSYQCDLCSQQFKTFSDYCEHRRESHGDENVGVDYSCDKCGKMFFTERSLATHKQTHSTKTVRCILDDCPVMSFDEDDLEEHVKEFHNKKDYTCDYDDCKKKFMKKFHLHEHIRVKHFNIRAYQCSWPGCCKEFAAERHLKVHLLIHKDEKPLKCDFCEYRCRQRNAMNWHMRKHPEAPYRYRKFGMLSAGDD